MSRIRDKFSPLDSAARRVYQSRSIIAREVRMERIGFIGLGAMGRPMAGNLRRKGFELLVYDVKPEPCADLAALGATVAKSVGEVAREAAIVVTMLPDSPDVE